MSKWADENTVGYPLRDVFNRRQMQKWKKQQISQDDAIHVSCSVGGVDVLWSHMISAAELLHHTTPCLCLLNHPLPERTRDSCVMNASERRIICTVVHVWKTNSGESLDPILRTSSRVLVWKRLLSVYMCLRKDGVSDSGEGLLDWTPQQSKYTLWRSTEGTAKAKYYIIYNTQKKWREHLIVTV